MSATISEGVVFEFDGVIARPFGLPQLIIPVEGIWSIDDNKNLVIFLDCPQQIGIIQLTVGQGYPLSPLSLRTLAHL